MVKEVWYKTIIITPWKFNSSPLKFYHPKRKGSSSNISNYHFSGVHSLLNFGGLIVNKVYLKDFFLLSGSKSWIVCHRMSLIRSWRFQLFLGSHCDFLSNRIHEKTGIFNRHGWLIVMVKWRFSYTSFSWTHLAVLDPEKKVWTAYFPY